MAIRKFIISQTTHGVMVQIEPLKFELFSYLRRRCWHGGLVARGKASFSCSILCPFHLKRRMSANSCFLSIDFGQKVSSYETLNSRNDLFYANKREFSVNIASSKQYRYGKWKNSIFNPSNSFLALKNANARILSTFEKSFSKKKKKIGKTPSSHIIHSLGGE